MIALISHCFYLLVIYCIPDFVLFNVNCNGKMKLQSSCQVINKNNIRTIIKNVSCIFYYLFTMFHAAYPHLITQKHGLPQIITNLSIPTAFCRNLPYGDCNGTNWIPQLFQSIHEGFPIKPYTEHTHFLPFKMVGLTAHLFFLGCKRHL